MMTIHLPIEMGRIYLNYMFRIPLNLQVTNNSHQKLGEIASNKI